mgnify:CR=1 FL=1|uniref:Uncharacterized protein n=1 Tax=viral metagenome TaxID=1070528 RepID=A0A6C0LZ38_9ZZZZ
MVFIVFYIQTDIPENSEVLGVFNNKEEAVRELLERANYREKNGKLTQYMDQCDEYDSFADLYNIVFSNMELVDVDIYRITEIPL